MKLPCISLASLAQPSAASCLGMCWASIPIAQGQQPLVHDSALIVSVAAGVLGIDAILTDTAASTEAHICVRPPSPLGQLPTGDLAAHFEHLIPTCLIKTHPYASQENSSTADSLIQTETMSMPGTLGGS